MSSEDLTHRSGSPGENRRINNENSKEFVIPASVTDLTRDVIANADSVEIIRFEPGSQIRGFENSPFDACKSLKSICIPASVEMLCTCCFVGDRFHEGERFLSTSGLENVTFEPGSQLREIEVGGFYGCESVKHLCIPASVETMSAASLPTSRKVRIEIETGNRYFYMNGDFLMHLDDSRLCRYCGTASEVTIADEIEQLEEYCFGSCELVFEAECLFTFESVRCVKFGSMSKLSSIEESAFSCCRNLETITIPASVRFIGEQCFESCDSLRTVSFCSGCLLDCIPTGAFSSCWSLESIVLPPSVTTVGELSFYECSKLATWPLPPDSQAVRICSWAFRHCSSLKSVFLPASVEFVGDCCFYGCNSVSSLTFGEPSHLRELLEIPPLLPRTISLPDSVERFRFTQDLQAAPGRTFRFGPESRLMELHHVLEICRSISRVFLQVSTRSLKRLRTNFEFK
jgi:hypothetical protein